MALMKLATTWERFILKDLTKFGRYAKVSLLLITRWDKFIYLKIFLKGTISVILSDPSGKDGDA